MPMPSRELDHDDVPREYRDAITAGDPSAMMAVGRRSRSRAAAKRWYQWAAERGHAPGMLAMAMLDAEDGNYERARAWLARLPRRTAPRDRIAMAGDLFDRQGEAYSEGDGWSISHGLLLISPDGDRAYRALARAGKRFYKVTTDGREAADWEVCTQTPSHVSAIYQSAAGGAMYVDTRGELTAAMGARLLAVLAEELAEERVAALVTAPVPAEPAFGNEWIDPAAAPTEARWPLRPPTAWYLVRPVRRTTTDGRAYFGQDFRTDDGAWVRDKSRGVRRDGPLSQEDIQLCMKLRAESRDDRHGEPVWLHLSVAGPANPDAPPPELQLDD
jgi:hypothetical protein